MEKRFGSFLRYWQESLQLFLPQNFKLFLLVTLNATVQVYTTFARYFWWLYIVTCALTVMAATSAHLAIHYGANALWFACIFALFLTVRPSVQLKNYSYYCSFLPRIVSFFAISAMACIARALLANTQSSLHASAFAVIARIFAIAVSAIIFIFPYCTCTLLVISPFLVFALMMNLDRHQSIARSLWLSVKMVIYNLPFCIIGYALLLAFLYAFNSIILVPIISLLLHLLGIIDYAVVKALLICTCRLMYVFPVCFFANFYTKKVHDQFTQLFGRQ